jgi:hypothetical protein
VSIGGQPAPRPSSPGRRPTRCSRELALFVPPAPRSARPTAGNWVRFAHSALQLTTGHRPPTTVCWLCFAELAWRGSPSPGACPRPNWVRFVPKRTKPPAVRRAAKTAKGRKNDHGRGRRVAARSRGHHDSPRIPRPRASSHIIDASQRAYVIQKSKIMQELLPRTGFLSDLRTTPNTRTEPPRAQRWKMDLLRFLKEGDLGGVDDRPQLQYAAARKP